MAKYYGRIRSNEGEATRQGKDPGLVTHAETWDAVIRADLRPHPNVENVTLGELAIESKEGRETGLAFTLEPDALVRHYQHPKVVAHVEAVNAAAEELRDELERLEAERRDER